MTPHYLHTGDDDVTVIGYMTAANRQFYAIDQSLADRDNPFAVYELEPDGRMSSEYMTDSRSDALNNLWDRARRWCEMETER